jgi:hypothetical protein
MYGLDLPGLQNIACEEGEYEQDDEYGEGP